LVELLGDEGFTLRIGLDDKPLILLHSAIPRHRFELRDFLTFHGTPAIQVVWCLPATENGALSKFGGSGKPLMFQRSAIHLSKLGRFAA